MLRLGTRTNAANYHLAAKQYVKVLEGSFKEKQKALEEANARTSESARTSAAAFVSRQLSTYRQDTLRKLQRMESQIGVWKAEIGAATDKSGRKVFNADFWLDAIKQLRTQVNAAKSIKEIEQLPLAIGQQVLAQYQEAKQIMGPKIMREKRSETLQAMIGQREKMLGVLADNYR